MRTVEESFWAKVAKSDGCWEWTAYRDRDGYGRFRSQLAHRAAWMLAGNPLPPPGMQLDHLCRNPPCVNPAHLEAVTPAENTRRAAPATKTACVRGHPFDEANTYWKSDAGQGRRGCRRCRDEAVQRYRETLPKRVRTPEQRHEIARHAALVRWARKAA